jgi:NADH-quinone oxidoreductase subunit E
VAKSNGKNAKPKEGSMSSEQRPEETMKTDNPFAAYAAGMTELQKEAMRWMSATSTPQMSGMANLAAHPLGAMAAASAVGMGVASQMFGMMAGAMAGAMKSTDMLSSETTGGLSAPFGAANPLNFDWATGSFEDKPEPEAKAKAPAKKAEPALAKTATAKPVKKAKAETKTKAAPASAAKKAPVAVPAEPVAIAEAAVKREPAEVAEIKISPVMPEDFVKPNSMKKPDQPDDLKGISGIGPKLESVLNSLGVWTYAQIAAWTPEEIAWVDDYLQFKGRIERDEWIAQAAALASKA